MPTPAKAELLPEAEQRLFARAVLHPGATPAYVGPGSAAL